MSGKTSIEWADRVWNPVVGCTKVSEGCRNCYAERLHEMRHQAYLDGKKVPVQYAKPFNQVQFMLRRSDDPLRWKKPSRIFVNSMSDLFHGNVEVQWLAAIFNTIASWRLVCKEEGCNHTYDGCAEDPRHIFMILTKRPEQMKLAITESIPRFVSECYPGNWPLSLALETGEWPLKNVWLGVSVENQRAADERIPLLLDTPAAVRFVSCEPLLGPVDLSRYLGGEGALLRAPTKTTKPGLDWVICGGESGPNARPMHPGWVESLKDQCQAASVPFFFKQWGEYSPKFPQGLSLANRHMTFEGGEVFYRVGKKAAGRLLDGREWNEFPEAEK